MVVHLYSCLLTGIIPVQIHTGIITWNGTGIFMNSQAYSCSWNFRNWNIHEYSSLFMFLEFQESREGMQHKVDMKEMSASNGVSYENAAITYMYMYLTTMRTLAHIHLRNMTRD